MKHQLGVTRRQVRSLFLSAVATLAWSMGSAASIHITNPDGQLEGAKVQDNYKLVGFVGDYLSLEPGAHELQIAAPRDFTIILKLLVSENSAAVVDSRTEPGRCKPNFATTWNPPTIADSSTKKQKKKKASRGEIQAASGHSRQVVSTLILNAPQYGEPINSGACYLPSMLGCTKRFAVVSVDSTPQGAEVWIDDKRMSVKTKANLSVAFCPDTEKTKHILVRMPGKTNCARDVSVAEGEKTSVTCDLPAPN